MDQFSHDPIDAAIASAPRGAARDSLFLMGELRIDGRRGAAQVRVRNLSSCGLMAEYPHPIDQGTAITIVLRNIGDVGGRVAWCTAGRVGIAFDQPIDPKQARKPVVSATAATSQPMRAIFPPR